MMDVLVELYALTGNPRYLETSRRFYHRAVLDPLLAHRDELPGQARQHCQIPKVIGEARTYEVTGEPTPGAIAEYFWDLVAAPLLLRDRRRQRGRALHPEQHDVKDTWARTRRRPATPTTCSS
jgi:hypothetical protein